MTETTATEDRTATAPLRAPRQPIDWPTIRAAYVEGRPAADGTTYWPSLRELAEEFRLNQRHLGATAAAEQWTRERALFRRRVDEARQNERVDEIARIAADLDVAALKAARDGLAITHARIQELGLQANRRMAALAAGTVPVDAPSDALELERLARSLDEYYTVATSAIGLAPRTPVDVVLHSAEDGDDVETRDARTLGVLALIKQYAPEMMPAHLEDVIDVDSNVLALVPGGDQAGDLGRDDAEGEPVPADDADVG